MRKKEQEISVLAREKGKQKIKKFSKITTVDEQEPSSTISRQSHRSASLRLGVCRNSETDHLYLALKALKDNVLNRPVHEKLLMLDKSDFFLQ